MATSYIAMSSWWRKVVEVVLAGWALINCALISTQLLPESWLHWWLPVLRYSFFGELAVVLLGTAFAVYWQRQEQKRPLVLNKAHAWLQGIIRYWLAFEISLYGFAKILHTQFSPPHYIQDLTVGSLNGFNLTWSYFGYSYPFAVIIASVQISGAVLLLFRRTTLLGAVILFPVMIVILLINVFYAIAAGAFIQSVLLTLGLAFLILPHAKKLIGPLLGPVKELPELRLGIFRIILKVFAIGAAFLLIYNISRRNISSAPEGKWQVDRIVRNGDTLSADTWLTDRMNWKNIYLEGSGEIIFCSNPYVFDAYRSIRGRCQYNNDSHSLNILFEPGYSEPDSVRVAITYPSEHRMEWKMTFQRNALRISLSSRKKISAHPEIDNYQVIKFLFK